MFRAVLDTCALVPGRQRDFLLQLAAEGAYAPLWGTGVLFELDYVLEELDATRGVPESSERRRHLFDQMAKYFPGATITAPKDRIYDYDLIDEDDGHVAHAAIMGKADAIVTDDTRAGFKTSAVLLAADIETVFPAEFAANTVGAHPGLGLRAIMELSRRMTRPPVTPLELLQELQRRYGMEEVFDLLSPRVVDA